MSPYRVLSLCLVAVMVAGCSWRNVATFTADVPQALRLNSSYDVAVQQRYLIAQDAPVLIDNHEGVPPDVLAAAYRGLAEVFPASGDHGLKSDSILLRVRWPEFEAPVAQERRFIGMSVFGEVEVPRAARTDALPVLVLDVNGDLVTAASLSVSPALWATSWPDLDVVERGFAELAARLRDG